MHARGTPEINWREAHQFVIDFPPGAIIPQALLSGVTGHSDWRILIRRLCAIRHNSLGGHRGCFYHGAKDSYSL